MKSDQAYHVISHPRGWAVVRGRAHRASKLFEDKKDAVAWGEQASRDQGFLFVIHRTDGTVERMDSYGRESHS